MLSLSRIKVAVETGTFLVAMVGGTIAFYTQIIEPRHWPPSPVMECKIDTLENTSDEIVLKFRYGLKNLGNRPFRIIDGWAAIDAFRIVPSPTSDTCYAKWLSENMKNTGDAALWHKNRNFKVVSTHLVDYYRPIHDYDLGPQQNVSFEFISRIKKDTVTSDVKAFMLIANAVVRDEAHKDHFIAFSEDTTDGTNEFIAQVKADSIIGKHNVNDNQYMRDHHFFFSQNSCEIIYH